MCGIVLLARHGHDNLRPPQNLNSVRLVCQSSFFGDIALHDFHEHKDRDNDPEPVDNHAKVEEEEEERGQRRETRLDANGLHILTSCQHVRHHKHDCADSLRG